MADGARRLRDSLWTVAALFLVIALWEGGVRLSRVPLYLLPGPGYVLQAVIEHWQALLGQAVTTMGEVLAGFVLAALVAIPLAMLVVVSPVLERLVYPPM